MTQTKVSQDSDIVMVRNGNEWVPWKREPYDRTIPCEAPLQFIHKLEEIRDSSNKFYRGVPDINQMLISSGARYKKYSMMTQNLLKDVLPSIDSNKYAFGEIFTLSRYIVELHFIYKFVRELERSGLLDFSPSYQPLHFHINLAGKTTDDITLGGFVEGPVNYNSLPIPIDRIHNLHSLKNIITQQINTLFTFKKEGISRSFAYPSYFPRGAAAFALARHHGIPVGLLDFSEDPLVAAYFATCKYVSRQEEYNDYLMSASAEHKLAVWCVDNSILNERDCVVYADVSNNIFAQRQQGKFLDLREEFPSDSINNGNPRCIIPQLAGEWLRRDFAQVVTLRWQDDTITELRRLLKNRGYSAHGLMPTEANIVEATLARTTN